MVFRIRILDYPYCLWSGQSNFLFRIPRYSSCFLFLFLKLRIPAYCEDDFYGVLITRRDSSPSRHGLWSKRVKCRRWFRAFSKFWMVERVCTMQFDRIKYMRTNLLLRIAIISRTSLDVNECQDQGIRIANFNILLRFRVCVVKFAKQISSES